MTKPKTPNGCQDALHGQPWSNPVLECKHSKALDRFHHLVSLPVTAENHTMSVQ
jgi:hypothetical protein